MRTFLCALCVLGVTPVLATFSGYCPRKEPPPGVVVVSQDSTLVLTCSGHVILDGAKVVPDSHSAPAAVTRSTVNSISHNAVLPEGEGPIIPTSSSSSVSQPKSEWDAGRVEGFQDEYDEEEKDERAVKMNIQWKFPKDGQGTVEGSTLSVSRVRVSDSGRYSCLQGGIERFSTRIIVAEAPETPHLSCYKKSPSSKIRCEWTARKPAHQGTRCSLLIRKRLEGGLDSMPCSYSVRRSRCWCTLDHNEDDNRAPHQALLCVSSFSSNATSDLLSFTPMQILKPDPPYNVSVQALAGLSRSLLVTWRPPYTWKLHDRFYELVYEIRYKPLMSNNYQTVSIAVRTKRHTVTDAEAGQEYEVQVRAKDEYDGQWSAWSPPQYARSWTPVSDEPQEDLSTLPFPFSYSEGSGAEDSEDMSLPVASPQTASHHYLWTTITVFMGVSLIILTVYTIRYKDRCMSKLHRLGVLGQCGAPVPPRPAPADAGPALAERHTLLNTAQPPSEAKDRNEQELKPGERTEATNFNNTSYFLVPGEI